MLRLIFLTAICGLLGFGLYQAVVFALFVANSADGNLMRGFLMHLIYVGLGVALAAGLVWTFIRPETKGEQGV